MSQETGQGYQPLKIEPKWQRYWDDNKTFRTTEDAGKPKFYALDMFPYSIRSGTSCRSPGGLYGDRYR